MGLEKTAVESQTPQQMSFSDFIRNVAARAGMTVRVSSPEQVIVPFDMGDGRSQNVFVRLLGKTNEGHFIVGMFSPALKLPAGQPLGQKTANDLLRRNGTLPHGNWAIVTIDNEDYLGMFDTHIAATMQPEEFRSSAYTLSRVADDMEKQLGSDSF
jgi:hypothetical protein